MWPGHVTQSCDVAWSLTSASDDIRLEVIPAQIAERVRSTHRHVYMYTNTYKHIYMHTNTHTCTQTHMQCIHRTGVKAGLT